MKMKTKKLTKRLFKTTAIIVLALCAMITAFDIVNKIYNSNPKNWPTFTIHTLVITDDAWQQQDIQVLTAEMLGYNIVESELAIPFRYALEREKYVIDVVVNPAKHERLTTLQILATHNISGDILTIESQWDGNCAMIEKVSKSGKWEKPIDVTDHLLAYYFTNPKATGFMWFNSTGFCKEERPKTPEYNSQFPIILKIYHNNELIGREEVPIKIFDNGIKRRKPLSYDLTLWGLIFYYLSNL